MASKLFYHRKPCQSTQPKPARTQCLFPGCDVMCMPPHWACRPHWGMYPRRFILYANAFKAYWAGDPNYDIFAERARIVGQMIKDSEELTGDVLETMTTLHPGNLDRALAALGHPPVPASEEPPHEP